MKLIGNDKCPLSLSKDQKNISLCDILKKLEDTTFTILLREKLLSQEMEYSLRRNLFPKESVGEK